MRVETIRSAETDKGRYYSRRVLDMSMYTREETARELNIGLRTLDRRIATGELKCYRLGAGPRAPVRISEKQLTDYLAACTKKRRRETRREARNIMRQRASG